MTSYHQSVLLQEAISALSVEPGKRYIDATLGGGGHAEEILNLGGVVLGIDMDEDAILHVRKRFEGQNLTLMLGNFKDIREISQEAGFEKVSGILFDLGVSSYQLDQPQRGFSYLKKGPLDMRMGKSLGVKAADLVNALGRRELYEIFSELGEERNARTISDSIVSARRVKAFETTTELAKVVSKAYGFKDTSEFALATANKKVFQALRIAVNDEINNLKEALPNALEILGSGGRMVVITFHSLEDRVVKRKFLEFEEKGMGKVITKTPILPKTDEIKRNKRSKGAKLRVFEKFRSAESE